MYVLIVTLKNRYTTIFLFLNFVKTYLATFIARQTATNCSFDSSAHLFFFKLTSKTSPVPFVCFEATFF